MIIAGGELNQEFASCYIREHYPDGRPELMIVADRGLQWAEEMNLRPDIILGDYDSVPPERLEKYLGATGSRMDHMLANLGLLYLCLQAGIPAELVNATNRIRLIRDTVTLRKDTQFGTYVSLLPYTERVTGITLTGFQYPLQDAELSLGLSRGVSNEIAAETATIQIRSGALLVIESRD